MRGVRRTWPIWVAVIVHAAAAIAVARARLPEASPRRAPVDDAIVVEEVAPEAPSADEPHESPRESVAGAVSEAFAPTRSGVPIPAPSPAPEATPEPAASATAWSFSPTGPMDLGIGTYWRTYAAASSAPRPSPSVDEGARNGDFPRRLSADLRAHDVDTGHSIASPLVAAAHDAASPHNAPDVGSVTIEVEADASGEIVAAHVVEASGDPSQWEGVAAQIRRSMARKRLRIPEGARGVRAHLRIVAERTLPSGEHTSVHAGAAPDEACDGSGPSSRCTSGMPGVGGTWGDLSNIGARRSRVVHVQLLDETLL